MTSIFGSLFLLLVASVTTRGDRTIHLSNIMGHSNFGDFKPALICPLGKKVTGFRVKVGSDTEKDKAGLTGIELICQDGTKVGPVEMDLGKWQDWEYCDGQETKNTNNYVKEFNYRSHKKKMRGRFWKHGNVDYLGGTQIRMKCSNDAVLDSNNNADKVPVGEWDQEDAAGCSATSSFCGVAAEVEVHRKKRDDTGLNRMKFYCCTPSAGLEDLEGWIPLGKDVCIGTRQEKFGFVKMPKAGLLSAIKFLYVDGTLSCNARHARFDSNFGCNYPHLRGAFSIFVTNFMDQQILPDSNNIKHPQDHLFYTVVDKEARSAKNFTLFAAEPTYTNIHDEVRIWYGEDYKNRHDWDNGDQEVCVNIYGQFKE